MDAIQRIRVLIADDHTIVRAGLRHILESYGDFEVVGEAANGIDAVRGCALYHPDVLLMDLNMPQMDGIAAAHQIHKSYPQVWIVALTNRTEREHIQAALQAGVLSYLLKTAGPEEVVRAIRDACYGKPTLSPEAMRILIQAATGPQTPGHDLTGREREVLSLLAKGLGNMEIGQKLHISPATVKNHLNNIFSKLHVTNRTEAATLALQHHLVQFA